VNSPSLATRAIRSFLWTGSPFLIQLFTILLFYAVEEMGIFETALALVMFLALIGDLGMNATLVQLRDAEERHFSTAFWTNLFWGLILTALILFSAPLMATLLSPQNPAAFQEILTTLCLLIPFASISGILRARLQRGLHMRSMRAMALAEIFSVVAYSLAAIALLPLYGLQGLVIGSIGRELALLASLWFFASWRPQFCFSPAALKEMLRFALNFTGERTVGFLNSRLIQFLILRYLGATAAGHYGFASRVSLIPLIRLSTIIHRVGLPAFSSIQHNDAQLGRGYIAAIQSIALFFWPPLMGLFVFAPEVVQLVKAEMQPAITTLRLLVLAVVLKAVGSIVSTIFLAKGKAHWSFRWALFCLAVLVPALWFSVRYGVEGLAAAILLTALLFFAISQFLVHRLIHFDLKHFASALCRPLLITVVILGVLIWTRPLLLASPLTDLLQSLVPLLPLNAGRFHALVTLSQAGFLGLLIYSLALRFLAWDLCRGYWQNLRGQQLDVASADSGNLE
jgi:O-antigen/teichoic acid export membrane protein